MSYPISSLNSPTNDKLPPKFNTLEIKWIYERVLVPILNVMTDSSIYWKLTPKREVGATFLFLHSHAKLKIMGILEVAVFGLKSIKLKVIKTIYRTNWGAKKWSEAAMVPHTNCLESKLEFWKTLKKKLHCRITFTDFRREML